jgi:hypothetical protein
LKPTVDERFWSKVNIKGEDDCWNWMANIDTPGYGGFKYNGKKMNSNRVAWILTRGEIPKGLWVLHKCKENRLCCNPNHLYLGTRSDNARDAVRDGTLNIMKKHKIGEECNGVKLKNNDVLEIKRLLSLGKTCAEISKEYPVGRSEISRIKRGKNWAWLT